MNSKSGLVAGLAGLGLCLVLTLVYLGSDGFLGSDQTRDQADQAGQRPEGKRQQVLKGESGLEAREETPQNAHRTTLPEQVESRTDSQPSKSQAGKADETTRDAPARPEDPIETAIKDPLWEDVAESLRRGYEGYKLKKAKGNIKGATRMMMAHRDVLFHLLPDIPRLVAENKVIIKRETASPGRAFTATDHTSRTGERDAIEVRLSSKRVRLSFEIRKDMVPPEVWSGIAKWDAQYGRRK